MLGNCRAVCDSFCLETAEAAFLLQGVGKEQVAYR